jgi:poly-gamma-glutamate capsule biosynthesis protein CapA/YwtB (metallophosphatase superfamily)
MSFRTTLLLTGDVMSGRGIDQLMPTPNSPQLYEDYVHDARDYVRLAEARSGPIARPVGYDYIWGDALACFDRLQPDLRIVNLETAVTSHSQPWPGKGINYRMHPAHVGCLRAAKIDACALANNHVLDWEHAGLLETLVTLREAGISTAGAGVDAAQAAAPALLAGPRGRVLLFACATESSGVPGRWRADAQRPGVNLLPDLCQQTLSALGRQIEAARRAEDVVIVSLHWGGNWGHAIQPEERDFARGLIETGADIVHGHSSHHAKAFEVYRDRLILYGCGDFINDYEGIGGHEAWRGDLAPAYCIELDGRHLQSLRVELFKSERLRLRRASAADLGWWRATLNRECARFTTGYTLGSDGVLRAEAGARQAA